MKVRALYDKDNKVGAPKKVALGYWGYSSVSGPALRTVSALKKFGLTEDKQGRIVPTQVDRFLSDFRKTIAYAGLVAGEGETMPEGQRQIDQPGQPVNPRTPQPPSRLANAYPIPLKNQNQAMISFQRTPLEKADLDLLKKWIDLMADNLVEQAEQ